MATMSSAVWRQSGLFYVPLFRTHYTRFRRADPSVPPLPFLQMKVFLTYFIILVFSQCLLISAASAEGIQVKSAELVLVEENSYQLNAEFEINFSGKLEEAVTKGVPVTFVVEFGVIRPRWYWLDEDLVKAQQVIRLSYNALTRQYQLSLGTAHRNFSSFAEAKSELSKIREWPVFDRALIKKRNDYEAQLRIRLDVSQLPKPLQVNALASKDWNLESDWHRWPLTP